MLVGAIEINDIGEKNMTHKSTSGNSPRETTDNPEEDENLTHKSSLENSPGDTLGNQEQDEKNVTHESSLEKDKEEAANNQDEDEKNETHERSLENTLGGIVDKHDEDKEKVADNQDEDEKNVTHESHLENTPVGIVDKPDEDKEKMAHNQDEDEKNVTHESNFENTPRDTLDNQEKDKKNETYDSSLENSTRDILDNVDKDKEKVTHKSSSEGSPTNTSEAHKKEEGVLVSEMKTLKVSKNNPKNQCDGEGEQLDQQEDGTRGPGSDNSNEVIQAAEDVLNEEEADPVFDGTEVGNKSPSRQSLDLDPETQAPAWPDKAVALTNYVKGKGVVAVSCVLRRLSGKKDDLDLSDEEEKNVNEDEDSSTDVKQKEVAQKAGERATWNPLNYIKIGRDTDTQDKSEQMEDAYVDNSLEKPVMKGRILVYTRLGCQECKEIRSFMHQKRLKYVEINIDIYPSRKLELEKNTGSCAVPRVYFNDFHVGGLSELKAMDESGKLEEKIDAVMKEEPSPAAPMPPLSGEDDQTGCGKVDELASVVRKMKESLVLRDRFYRMRKFNNCFLGSEAADFLSEDQYLEREEAVEFGRKLASKHFFRHILDENEFEDGNHLYRFLEHDPIVMTQCYNISWGTIDVTPKPITEIASRLRFLCFAIFEAYVSEDGKNVDYSSIHNSEEFQRYLRIVEELQRVDLDGLSREETLAFFINLYNMMAIHGILTWGYPVGALGRRRFLGDFKYVVGGCTYSLSAIQNGILRGNQRPPYNLLKPFGPKDKRFKVALPFPEPLAHFALDCGTRSGPALRCYSPGNIDKELMEAAHDFLSNGGLVVDAEAKVASATRILRWYSVDFGKNEVEVMKHAANYLEPGKSEELLELLANSQLKVIYQPYDWALNS